MGDAIHVRLYRDDDLPAVLELLRAALGETDVLQRTPELFRWKHLDNPFGRSVLLVAEIDDSIVGLRAFMRWELHHAGGTIACGRAVDTATHPDHLRKGIFRRLTEEALDVAREAGVALIFNTPNERSRSGYLKMGWSDVGPLRVLVRLHPARLARGPAAAVPDLHTLAPAAEPIDAGVFTDRVDSTGLLDERLQTIRTNAYLGWRFADHPTVRYGWVTAGQGTAVVRPNLRRGRGELVLSDALGTDPTAAVRRLVRSSRAAYDIALFSRRSPGRRAALRSGMIPVPGVAAMRLVARPLEALDVDVLDPTNWRLALSDLELL